MTFIHSSLIILLASFFIIASPLASPDFDISKTVPSMSYCARFSQYTGNFCNNQLLYQVATNDGTQFIPKDSVVALHHYKPFDFQIEFRPETCRGDMTAASTIGSADFIKNCNANYNAFPREKELICK
jgi:hypothetical protein